MDPGNCCFLNLFFSVNVKFGEVLRKAVSLVSVFIQLTLVQVPIMQDVLNISLFIL